MLRRRGQLYFRPARADYATARAAETLRFIVRQVHLATSTARSDVIGISRTHTVETQNVIEW